MSQTTMINLRWAVALGVTILLAVIGGVYAHGEAIAKLEEASRRVSAAEASNIKTVERLTKVENDIGVIKADIGWIRQYLERDPRK